MQPEQQQSIRPFAEIASALRSLVRAPFLALLLLDFLIAATSAGIGDLLGPNASEDSFFLVLTSSLFFAGATIYLQIAVMLAAGGSGDVGGADAWVKAAIRNRCFWRFLGVSVLAAFLILVGAVALIVGAIVIASSLLLSQPAVVLERKLPKEALQRSAELSKPARVALGTIFLLLWLPPLVLAVVFDLLDVDLDVAVQMAVGFGSSVLGMAATITVTRVFVKLGGAPTPPLQTLLYKAAAGSPR